MHSIQSRPSNQARFKVRILSAAQERDAGDSRSVGGSTCAATRYQMFGEQFDDRLINHRRSSLVSGSCAPARLAPPAIAVQGAGALRQTVAVLVSSASLGTPAQPRPGATGTAQATAKKPRPNPSLERTSTSWPRSTALLFSVPRGQPVASAQLKR